MGMCRYVGTVCQCVPVCASVCQCVLVCDNVFQCVLSPQPFIIRFRVHTHTHPPTHSHTHAHTITHTPGLSEIALWRGRNEISFMSSW